MKYYKVISIHAPRAGSDDILSEVVDFELYFNPRSPCGERRHMLGVWMYASLFQSTLPVRGATIVLFDLLSCYLISIHAPRAGSDRLCSGWSDNSHNFNPRSPCGERPVSDATIYWPFKFQSTLPVRGATPDWTHTR